MTPPLKPPSESSATGRHERDIDIAVVGAGPAGLFAAETLAAAGRSVTVFDHLPSPARKLLMAGRGGLNLTHSEAIDRFLLRYRGDRQVLAAAIRAFPPADLVAWAEGLGIATFTGSSGRIFPKAMKASPVLRAWLRRLDELGVALQTRYRLIDLDPTRHGNSPVRLTFQHSGGDRRVVTARAALLALGGASWPRLGSDGRWTAMLAAHGVEISELKPANAGLLVRWSPHLSDRFAGTPLKRIVLEASGERFAGELIITRTGLEGGPAYAASSLIRDRLQTAPLSPVPISLDLRPDLDIGELACRLDRPHGKQSRANRLRKSAGLPPVAIALLRESEMQKTVARPSATAASGPEQLAQTIKALPLAVRAVSGLERAISTAGGISLTSLTDHYMLSALPGVYACGEMLDWEAPTGGYLLQACFATARAAAEGLLADLD